MVKTQHAIDLQNGRMIGDDQPVYVVAEVGINHNGNMDLCEELIIAAKESGADAVKFQKRTLEAVYTEEELAAPRDSPFGKTNGDLKRQIEFWHDDYEHIVGLCEKHGLDWSASCWDVRALEFIETLDPAWHKVAGAMVTNWPLLKAIQKTGKPVFISHGMSTAEEFGAARHLFDYCVAMHCVSSYPTAPIDARISEILRMKRSGDIVGYSGHEMGTAISIAAVALGAKVIERHLTISRRLWGSDQKVSLEPAEFRQMVEGIRQVEQALSCEGDRTLYDCERKAWEKLRRDK